MNSVSKYILLEAYKDEPAEIKKIISKISSLSHKKSRLSKAGQDTADVDAEIQKMKSRLLELKGENPAGSGQQDTENDINLNGGSSDAAGGLSDIWNLDNIDFNTNINTAVDDSVKSRKILKHILSNEFIMTDDYDSITYLNNIKLGLTPLVYLQNTKRDAVNNMSLQELREYITSNKYTVTLKNKKLSIIYDGNDIVNLYYTGIPDNNTDNYITAGKVTELYTNLELTSVFDSHARYSKPKIHSLFDKFAHYHSYGNSYTVPVECFEKITCGSAYTLKNDCVLNNQEINIINGYKKNIKYLTFKYMVPSLKILNSESNGRIFNSATINFETPDKSFILLNICEIEPEYIVQNHGKWFSEIYTFNELAVMTPEQRLADLNKELSLYNKTFNFNGLKTNCANIYIQIHYHTIRENPFVIALGVEYINNSLMYLRQILELPENAEYEDIKQKLIDFGIIHDTMPDAMVKTYLNKLLITLHQSSKKINKNNVNFKFKFPKLSHNYVNKLFKDLPASINAICISSNSVSTNDLLVHTADYCGFYLKKYGSYWILKPTVAVRGI